jgi:hypothetical protein
MPMRQRAVELARELGLQDRCVSFGDWVDYADWPNYLLEADVGVSLHFDTLETRLAFRSRVLDYVWAGLPMVVTRGDATSELVSRYRLGRVVDYGDVQAVTEAILELLGTDPEIWRIPFEEARAELTWERAAQPLVAFCMNPRRSTDRRRTSHGIIGPEIPQVELEVRLAQQERELARLRSLVAGYERGRFIRFMRWLHRLLAGRGDK